eukprot:UN10824
MGVIVLVLLCFSFLNCVCVCFSFLQKNKNVVIILYNIAVGLIARSINASSVSKPFNSSIGSYEPSCGCAVVSLSPEEECRFVGFDLTARMGILFVVKLCRIALPRVAS